MSQSWDDAGFRERVQSTLSAFLDGRREELAPLGDDAALLIDEAQTCVGGGKRFRASFCYWGFRAVRSPGDDEEALIRACAALEMLHASALVHDDLMDASDTRRGRPATHVSFSDRHRARGWRGNPGQYGAASAILLGDLLLGWAEQLLRTCGLETATVAQEIFDRCRTEVIAGQFLDVSVQARGIADVDQAMTVLRYKSAKYSIERPLQIGAALAGADETTIEALGAFGLPLGEAFQLRDDLLGVYGDPEATGKPAGDDLVEGKRTVLIALALDGLEAPGRAELDAALGRDHLDVDRLRRLITDSGAQAAVEEAISALVERALAALAAAPVADDARPVLTHLADAATQRSV